MKNGTVTIAGANFMLYASTWFQYLNINMPVCHNFLIILCFTDFTLKYIIINMVLYNSL